MRFAVLGLGEAGSLFASDLAAAGVHVTAFDPAAVATPEGVDRRPDVAGTVADAEIVLLITGAADAADVVETVVEAMLPGALLADLSTSAPDAKAARAEAAAAGGRIFADVALMTGVPGRGMRTPAFVSGAGAERYAAAMGQLGVPVAAVGERAGDASTRKLLRSVTMKGLAAIVIEALRAAERAGLAEWLWADLVAELEAADAALLQRLVRGTAVHAARRIDEMEATADLLAALGVEPVMTRATVESLRNVLTGGVPGVPDQAKS
jgi:3-hydroxyisobutyrate dehydrogenase-like beta-hydroxyacid dehydrogenase